MSRTKTDDTTTGSKTEQTETTLEESASAAASQSVSAVNTAKTIERKMGAGQFLVMHPQDNGTAGLIRVMYAKGIMTETEWLATVKNLLAKKL